MTRGLAAITAPPRLDNAAVQAYFRTRRAVEREEFSALSVEDLRRYRDCHVRWARALDSRYTHWLQHGSTAGTTTHVEPRRVGGILITRPMTNSGQLASVHVCMTTSVRCRPIGVRCVGEQVERFVGVRRHDDAVSTSTQDVANEASNFILIFDDEDCLGTP